MTTRFPAGLPSMACISDARRRVQRRQMPTPLGFARGDSPLLVQLNSRLSELNLRVTVRTQDKCGLAWTGITAATRLAAPVPVGDFCCLPPEAAWQANAPGRYRSSDGRIRDVSRRS